MEVNELIFCPGSGLDPDPNPHTINADPHHCYFAKYISLELLAALFIFLSLFRAKRKVFRKALENIPNSVRLWKAAVELEV